MLTPHWTTLRLFLHVLGAAVWVGGQFVLAGLVPTVRREAPGATRALGAAFARLAWPAYVLLVGTGVWNVAAEHTGKSAAWRATLWAKVAVVAVSGVSAFAHQRATSRAGLAAWGAASGLTAVAALFIGILLAG